MTSKEGLNQEHKEEYAQFRLPIIWFMDQYLADLIEKVGKGSDLARRINRLAIDYDRTCAAAKVKLYDGIIEIMDQANKPNH